MREYALDCIRALSLSACFFVLTGHSYLRLPMMDGNKKKLGLLWE